MYLSRNSSSYMQRRGGFSLFPDNQHQGVSGMGDLYSDLGIDSTLTQASAMQSMPSASSNPFTELSATLAKAPTSLWLLLGGVVGLSLLIPSGRR